MARAAAGHGQAFAQHVHIQPRQMAQQCGRQLVDGELVFFQIDAHQIAVFAAQAQEPQAFHVVAIPGVGEHRLAEGEPEFFDIAPRPELLQAHRARQFALARETGVVEPHGFAERVFGRRRADQEPLDA